MSALRFVALLILFAIYAVLCVGFVVVVAGGLS